MALSIRQVAPALGAEVEDFDIAAPLTSAIVEELVQALAAHGVLVFRDQDLTPAQHIAFSRHFGELEEHVLAAALLEGYSEIYIVSNVVENGKAKGRAYAGTYWHSDMSYKPMPSMGSLMYALEVPEIGGDTMFANMYLAYERLSEGMRSLLEGLEAMHDFGHADRVFFSRRDDNGRLTETQRQQVPPSQHPVVRTHPVSGRRALFINEGFTSHFAGMNEEESRPLLDFLYQEATDPALVYRHQWRARDLVFWDNRCSMHKAIRDYDASRHMHRTTVRGDVPYLTRD